MFTKFTNGDTTRYDSKWYGFGTSNMVFKNNLALKGRSFFLNSYRTAPFYIRTFTTVGRIHPDSMKYNFRKRAGLFFTGSMEDPYHSWRFRIGRCYVGGTTPKWILSFAKKYRHWQWLREAKRTGEGLCPECKNGIILIYSGFPGETHAVCNKCNAHVGFDFDESAII